MSTERTDDARTPLLRSQESQDAFEEVNQEATPMKPTPLPKVQLGTVFLIKLLIPVAMTQALPYINNMTARLGLSEGARTGYYTGLLDSSFSIARLLSMYPWGRASDSLGRVPILAAGSIGIGVSSILFGLSRSFPALLFSRFLTGVFCGTIGAIHSVVGELSDATNQSTAFPLYDIVSALGFVVGPLIGTFSDPDGSYKLWPWLDWPIFKAYPYLLPCVITAAFSVLVTVLCLFVLEETLPSRRKALGKHYVSLAAEEVHVDNDLQDAREQDLKPPSIKTILSVPVIRAISASSAALGFVAGSFNAVFVLMAYTPKDEGGLSLGINQIGRALSLMGAVSILLKLCLPIILRRYDTVKVFYTSMLVWPITFAVMPILNVFARRTTVSDIVSSNSGAKAILWIAISWVLFLSRVGCLAFSIVMILVREYAINSASLGTINGITEVGQSVAGSVGPSIISSLFALSVSKHLLAGQLWVLFIVVISILAAGVAHRIRHYRHV